MVGLHAALAWVAAAWLVGVLAIAVPTALGWLRSYRALDALLLAAAAAALLAAVAGLAVATTAAPPADPLHLLYGAIVAGVPIVTRIAAQGRPPRSVGRWVSVAALVALGATFRSFMTGS